MKKIVKKLTLAKETLLNLETGDLNQILGGVSDIRHCFTADSCDWCRPSRMC